MKLSSISLGMLVLSCAARAQQVPQLLAMPNAASHIDPSRPLNIGEKFYPPESLKRREEGQCVVQVNVDRTGEMHDPKIITSSGHERLDAACIAATTSGHLIPAMKDGISVDSVATIPINWVLDNPATLAACMATPESLPLQAAAASLPPLKERKKEGARILVRLFVAATGQIEGAKIDTSSGFKRLDEAALKSVDGQKLVPATAEGVPVPACVVMPVVFKLD